MSLVFAGVLPTTPLLLNSVHPDPSPELETLLEAGKKFEQELYLAKPDVVIYISNGAATIPETCTIHASPEFTASLSLFGDFSKETVWKGTPHAAAQIHHESYEMHLPIKLDSSDTLDPDTTVAVELAGEHITSKVLPIGSNVESVDQNVALGKLLHEFTMNQNRRFACVALGQLSATHTDDSPFGMVEGSSEFDEQLRTHLRNGDCAAIQHMHPDQAMTMQATLYTPLVILSGLCNSMNTSYTEMAYRIDNGIGYTIGTLDVS